MENLTVRQITPFADPAFLLEQLSVYKNSSYVLQPFDNRTVDFMDAFSKSVLSNRLINTLPEIAALGFWLRKANLLRLKQENKHLFDSNHFKVAPLGKVFHICPANVDTMFIYSLAVSVLMGNKNVLRVSNRMDAPHVNELFTILNSTILSDKFPQYNDYINIISYDHNDAISNWISENSNVRIIWGGDATIRTFKKFKTAPRTKDLVFADRVSVLCIDCKSYLGLTDVEKTAFIRNFFNDAYTFDQMGCSSPQTIYFLGNDSEYKKCTTTLHSDLSAYLKTNYKTDVNSLASLKLNRMVDDSMDQLITDRSGDNYISFLQLKDSTMETSLHGCGGGYFYVKNINSIQDLKNLSQIKVQTVSYFGLSETERNSLVVLANGEGIDRIVQLGSALNFNYIWDGYNLFDELSKKIFIN
jgi:hypothetical protein